MYKRIRKSIHNEYVEFECNKLKSNLSPYLHLSKLCRYMFYPQPMYFITFY